MDFLVELKSRLYAILMAVIKQTIRFLRLFALRFEVVLDVIVRWPAIPQNGGKGRGSFVVYAYDMIFRQWLSIHCFYCQI